MHVKSICSGWPFIFYYASRLHAAQPSWPPCRAPPDPGDGILDIDIEVVVTNLLPTLSSVVAPWHRCANTGGGGVSVVESSHAYRCCKTGCSTALHCRLSLSLRFSRTGGLVPTRRTGAWVLCGIDRLGMRRHLLLCVTGSSLGCLECPGLSLRTFDRMMAGRASDVVARATHRSAPLALWYVLAGDSLTLKSTRLCL